MAAIRYDITTDGVMVQVHSADPTDAEWTAMLDFVVAHRDAIQAIVGIGRGTHGPTSTQREQLSRALRQLHRGLPLALLTDSRATRGILTALNWLTGRHDESRAFALAELEQALDFLALREEQKPAVRALVSRLGG